MSKRFVPGKGYVETAAKTWPSVKFRRPGRKPRHQGELVWDDERKEYRFHDGVREKSIPSYEGK